MNFTKWLNTFVDEKGIDREQIIEAEGPRGMNFIPVECLLQEIIQAPLHEREAIKNMIVKIDFLNGDVMHYFKHLAHAIAR